MKVIILCGGKGTRIADADYEAKALVHIGGRPILWHIMKIYAAYGLTDFVLTLGHGATAIKQYFKDYEWMSHDFTITLGLQPDVAFHGGHREDSWEITLADTGLETNKGGRLRQVLKYLDDEAFHVTYGDGIGDLDISDLMRFHEAHGKLATVSVYQPRSQYGIVQFNDDGLVSGFEEKPRIDQWINAGFMIFEPGTREYLSGDDSLDLEKEVLVRLAEAGELMVYQHSGFWRSMDTFKEARELDSLWRNSAPWKVW